jgi:O-antigen ligase/tetratricopeptide (TPR) repeat protein
MLKKLEANYRNVIKGALLAVPLLSLLVLRAPFFPFITSRAFGFMILVEIAAIAWVGLLIINPTYRPKWSLLIGALTGFIAVIGVANITGIHFENSFWSRFQRMDGYVLFLHLAIYVVIIGSVFRTKKEKALLLKTFVGVGGLISVIGIFQKLGITPTPTAGEARVSGTLGNPAFLATYTLFIGAMALVSWISAKTKNSKRYYLVVAALVFIALLLTASRGPVIGLVAGLVVFIFLFALGKKDREKKYKKIGIALLVALIILPTAVWFARDSEIVQNTPLLSRSVRVVEGDVSDPRFIVWKIAWEGFKERPLLGWGQKNFEQVFNKNYDARLFNQEHWFDHPHNIVLGWLIEGGVLGLLGYLALYAAVIMTLWRAYKKGNIAFSELGVWYALLVAYFVQNLFTLDNINSHIMFFTVVAYVNGLEREEDEEHEIKNQNHEKTKKIALSTTGGAIVIGLLVMNTVNFQPFMNAYKLGIANNVLRAGGLIDDLIEEITAITNTKTYGRFEAKETFTTVALQMVKSDNVKPAERLLFGRTAAKEMEKGFEEAANQVRRRLMLGDLYNALTILDESYAKKGREHAEAALAVSDQRQGAYFTLADHYSSVGNFGKTLETLQQAVALDEGYPRAHANVAIIALAMDKRDIADEAVQKLISLPTYGERRLFSQVAEHYIARQEFSEALELYKIQVERDPLDPLFHANLAGLYLNQGFPEEALREAKRARELDPKNYTEPVKLFLQRLEKQ